MAKIEIIKNRNRKMIRIRKMMRIRKKNYKKEKFLCILD